LIRRLRPDASSRCARVAAQLQKYGEAIELLWFQYVVGYDKQEQRSLATSLHNQVFDYGRMVTNMLVTIQAYLTGI
jgi:hypothetical protein